MNRVSLRHQELLFIQGFPGWSLKDSPIVFFLRGCDLNRGMPLIRQALTRRKFFVNSAGQQIYVLGHKNSCLVHIACF